MDKESLEFLAKQAVEAERYNFDKPEEAPDHLIWMYDEETRRYTMMEIPQGPRDFKLTTPESFIEAVNHYHEFYTDDEDFCTAADAEGRVTTGATLVFVGDNAVSARVDDSQRCRDRLTMPLTFTPEFQRLRELERAGQGKGQQAFVDELRIQFARSVDVEVVDLFRSLRFIAETGNEGQVQTGRESVGRKLKRELLAGSDGMNIPDEICLRVFVYEEITDSNVCWPIRCAVRVDLDEQTFSLHPLAGELHNAKVLTAEWLQGVLTKGLADGVKVWLGSP